VEQGIALNAIEYKAILLPSLLIYFSIVFPPYQQHRYFLRATFLPAVFLRYVQRKIELQGISLLPEIAARQVF
jgi:hypothetical protein